MISLTIAAWLVLASPPVAEMVQAPADRTESVEEAILRALAADSVTAPYRFSTTRKHGRVVLSGRVGTKAVYDEAVRVALAVTPSFDDRLVIDTAEADRVAGLVRPVVPPPLLVRQPGVIPLVYPLPLFGRLDDPFFGFDPPIISYPPWWEEVASRRPDPAAIAAEDQAPPPPPTPDDGSAEPRAVTMTLDPLGVALLEGNVPDEEARQAIARKVAAMDGVTDVINRLIVVPERQVDPIPARPLDVPPPPPTPDPPPPAALDLNDDGSIEARVLRAIAQRPALQDSKLLAAAYEGSVTLTGRVPTALEAMLAFRAAQQTAGVREVVDRLEFAVPDGETANPLVTKASPEDLEPYLAAQIRRQLGRLARIDRVQAQGDRLVILGALDSPEDRARVEAALRSTPLLRGFTIELAWERE